jgi:hypothetical protein
VAQGGLPNCPVAAILAALARTKAGQKYLNGLITEYKGVAIKTTVSAEIIAIEEASTPEDPNNTSGVRDYKPQAGEIVSHRYFTVPIWDGEIPDTFYAKYSDREYTEPIFMHSPNSALWPAVIEKACALHYGSYKELGNHKDHTANEHWLLVVGRQPQGFAVSSSTNLDRIENAVSNSPQIPTIAASIEGAPNVTPMHAFAVLGMTSGKVDLYNPYGQPASVTLEQFRNNFQTILFGTP